MSPPCPTLDQLTDWQRAAERAARGEDEQRELHIEAAESCQLARNRHAAIADAIVILIRAYHAPDTPPIDWPWVEPF